MFKRLLTIILAIMLVCGTANALLCVTNEAEGVYLEFAADFVIGTKESDRIIYVNSDGTIEVLQEGITQAETLAVQSTQSTPVKNSSPKPSIFEWTDEILLLAMFEGGGLDKGYKREQMRGAALVATATKNRLLHPKLFENTLEEDLASGQYYPFSSIDEMREQMYKNGWTDEKISNYIERLRKELTGNGKFDWSEELSLPVYFYKRDDVQQNNKWWNSLPKYATSNG